MTRFATVVFLCLISFPAYSFSAVSCDQVRAYVAEHGKAAALAFAISQGATWAQIKEARKCLSSR